MQLITKKFLIISFIITIVTSHLKANDPVSTIDDFGIISIMYHRFDESKYPSTNIQMEVFKEQLKIIENSGMTFVQPKDFKSSLISKKKR